jgi:Viral BACON domain
MRKHAAAALFVALFVCFGVDVQGQCTLAPAVLHDPPNNSTAGFGSVTLRWDEVSGAAAYEPFVSIDGAPAESLGLTARTSATFLVGPGRHVVWAVKAKAPNCAESASQTFSFNTSCPDGRPQLTSPARNAQVPEGTAVNFSWSGVVGAESYDLVVTPDFGQTFTVLADDTTARSHSAVLPNGDWGWYVLANIEGNCPPHHSEPSSFSVGAFCDTTAPRLKSPANGATATLPVTFEWEAAKGAINYNVMAMAGGNLRLLGRTTGTSFILGQGIEGTFIWFVVAEFPDKCPSIESEGRTLTIKPVEGCGNAAAPVLFSPANGATNVASPVTFKWNPVSGAVRYALFVSTGGEDFDLYGTTQETSFEAFVPNGVIRWLVVALFNGCPETRSATGTFTAGRASDCPTGAITLRSPNPGATVSSPVTLSWSPVTGVQFYRITITDGEGSITRRTTSTVETIELPAGAMRWYVEGLREGCDPIVSPEGTFTVQRAANCESNRAATLISPIGGASVTSPVTLSWNAAANAIGYRVWIARGTNAFEDIGVTDKTVVVLPLPAGTYGWFIDAIFRGCDALSSSRATFVVPQTTARCSDAAPTPLAPAQGSRVAAPVEFRWTDINNAIRYRLFASIDGSEERLIGTTEETSLTRVLPPGAATWRVEAVFANCPSTSSPRIAFTIPEAANCATAAPQLLAPGNNTTLSDNEIEFAWTPVSGAVRYVIVARTEDGSPLPIGETAETTFSRRMPYGDVEWRVIAFFAGCDPQQSAPSRFTITPPQNCSNRAPVLLLPSERTPRVFSPVTFAWTRVPGATIYQIWVPQGSPLRAGIIAETTDNTAEVDLAPGTYQAFVIAKFANCPATESATVEFTVSARPSCGTPEAPEAHVIGQALSGTPYRVRWTPLPNVDLYEVQESTSADFANASTFIAEQPSLRFVHDVTGTPVQYLYRVRGISACDDSKGPFSEPVGVFVVPQRTNNASAELGVEGTIVQKVVLPGSPTPLPFVAKVDKPWLTVTPSSGTVGTEPVTLTVTADPNFLFLGTNTGTVTVTYTTPSAGNIATHGTTTATVPVSVSLVTPVTPGGKGTPPPESLIFPVVGHATGANDSLFESDIRVANLTSQTMKYQVTFTPSGTDGTQTGSSTTIDIPPNTTTALDDVVASVFGTGTLSSALGMLEVRPLTTSTTTTSNLFTTVASAFPPLATAASSRTYNFTPSGTFGQFIPAVPFAKFVGKGAVLSLLQVSQSANYRANFGFAEGSGSPVDLLMRVYDTKSNLLATIPVSLGASQHMQFSGLLQQNGINDLADGRVEVEVVNGNGKITAYVSEIDNKTNDPLLVNAVPKGATSANRYVVPGMAYINNGLAFWVSDLRIFNAGATTTATLTFHPQSGGAPVSKQVTIDAGEIEVLDNVVGNFFGQPNNAGGAIAITTATNTQLSATARTYNQTANGTYGQFIPAVTVAESIGAADRALQILQLETSSRIRTNVGVSETTGNPVTVEITAIQPDSIVTPVITMNLAANEFLQIPLANFFDPGAAVYNARVTVKVIAGTGRVTAYGSAIDVVTQDPTYVQAQ